MRDADDPQRPRDLLPRHIRRDPRAVPPRHHLTEGAGHLVGQVQAPGEQSPTLTEVRRRPLEVPLAADQLRRDQASAARERPVVGEPADEVANDLRGLGGRAQHPRGALEVDLIATHPAREIGSGGRAADVSEERDVVDRRALAFAASEPVGELERRQAHAELMLQRPAHPQVGGQRERRHHLRQADLIAGVDRLHGASLVFERLTHAPPHDDRRLRP